MAQNIFYEVTVTLTFNHQILNGLSKWTFVSNLKTLHQGVAELSSPWMDTEYNVFA